jgi:hypothetical protein
MAPRRPILIPIASHIPDEATKQALTALGDVKYSTVASLFLPDWSRQVLALDVEHHMSLSDYVKLYPAAKVFGPYPLVDKRKDMSVSAPLQPLLRPAHRKFDGVFGRDAEPLGDLSRSGEIQAEYFDGHANSDIAILHPASKTLVQADLLFNLPAYEQVSKTKDAPAGFWPLSILISKLRPGTGVHRFMLNGIAKDKAAFTASAKQVGAWDVGAVRRAAHIWRWEQFDRVIPCHGDIIETGGKKAWLETYRDFLKL